MSTPTPTHTAVQPLPCPFCGGAPTTISRPDNIDGTEFFAAVACYCGGYSACAHKMARAKTPGGADALAIAAWNRRASIPAVQGEQPCKARCQYAHDIGMQEYSCRNGCMYEKHAQGASQDARTSSVAPGGQPLPQADSKEGLGDSVLPSVEPPGATLSPCAASTAITPAIADALAKARLFVLCALRREGCRFTYHDQPEHWGDRLLEAIDKATQVDRGESALSPCAASQWISVDEGRPATFGAYLVWLSDVQDAGWDTGRAWTASWSVAHGWEDCVPMEDGCEVTHWMPLPAPPQVDRGESSSEGEPT